MESILVPRALAAGLPESSLAALLTAASAGTTAALEAVPGMNSSLVTVAVDGIADSYAASYAYVYYFALALGCVSIIASLCCMDFDHFLTGHVPHQIYHRQETVIDPLASDTELDTEVQSNKEQKV